MHLPHRYQGLFLRTPTQVYKLLIPIYESERRYEDLAMTYGACQGILANQSLSSYSISECYEAIIEQDKQQKRFFGTYFRVGFFCNGPYIPVDIRNKTFVSREPSLTSLAALSLNLYVVHDECVLAEHASCCVRSNLFLLYHVALVLLNSCVCIALLMLRWLWLRLRCGRCPVCPGVVRFEHPVARTPNLPRHSHAQCCAAPANRAHRRTQYTQYCGDEIDEIVTVADSKQFTAQDIKELPKRKLYLQLTFVTPCDMHHDESKRETTFEKHTRVRMFVFETPFTESGKARGDIASQRLRRTTLKVRCV